MYAVALYFHSVRVPPVEPAFIGAESSGSGFNDFFKLLAALFTYFIPRIAGSIDGIESAAAAKRLDGVHGNTERIGDFRIT